MVLGLFVSLLGAATATAADGQAPAGGKEKGTRVVIYPILVQAPIFGASIDLPSLPGGGGGSGGGESAEVAGETDIAINGAALFGVKVEADRWFAEFTGVWADVSAERDSPLVTIDSDTRLYHGHGGVRVVGGLFATGGFRRVTTELTATLTLPNSQRTITGTAKPGLWDPLIGALWRGGTRKLTVYGSFEGGGFGVGTDVELAGDVHADWEFIPHFILRGGYSYLYYKMTIANVNIGQFQRTLISKQTLNGPSVGLGISF